MHARIGSSGLTNKRGILQIIWTRRRDKSLNLLNSNTLMFYLLLGRVHSMSVFCTLLFWFPYLLQWPQRVDGNLPGF